MNNEANRRNPPPDPPSPKLIPGRAIGFDDFTRILSYAAPIPRTYSRGENLKNRLLREYQRQYGAFKVIFMPLGGKPTDEIEVDKDARTITILDFNNCVNFVHYFGTSIPKIEIAYYGIFRWEYYDDLHQLIHDFCNNLIEIDFNSPSDFPIKRNVEFGPFLTVRDVYLSYTQKRSDALTDYAIYLDLIERCFPNINMLFLHGIHENQRIMPAALPMNTLCLAYNEFFKGFQDAAIKLLDMNPWLKNFIFYPGGRVQVKRFPELMKFIRDEMPRLEELILIECNFSLEDQEDAVRFFRLCESLQRFQYSVFHESYWGDEDIMEKLDEIIQKLDIQPYTIKFEVKKAKKKKYSALCLPSLQKMCNVEGRFDIIMGREFFTVTLTKIYRKN